MRSRGGEVNKRKRRYDELDGILMAEKNKKRGWGGKKQKEEEKRREEKKEARRGSGLFTPS